MQSLCGSVPCAARFTKSRARRRAAPTVR
jgi:hypothetical protein